jgi:hypothetical protein
MAGTSSATTRFALLPGHDEFSKALFKRSYFIATAGSMNFFTTNAL